MVAGGKPFYFLDKIRTNYPIVIYGVTTSIGSTDPLKFNYLKQIRQLSEQILSEWTSDHLCFTTF